MMSNKSPKQTKRCGNAIVLSFALFLSLINLSCSGNGGTTVNTSTETSTPEKKVDDFQDNLNSVQRAGFTFIYGFRRPDNNVFTGEDKKYLKDNSPFETNQWRLTDDGKAVIAGSHYKFLPEHLDALRKRFNVEDYSKPVDESLIKNSNSENRDKISNTVK